MYLTTKSLGVRNQSNVSILDNWGETGNETLVLSLLLVTRYTDFSWVLGLASTVLEQFELKMAQIDAEKLFYSYPHKPDADEDSLGIDNELDCATGYLEDIDDIEYFLRTHNEDWFSAEAHENTGEKENALRLTVVY